LKGPRLLLSYAALLRIPGENGEAKQA